MPQKKKKKERKKESKKEKIKLQANITDEHRYKNSQQKYSKQNPTTY